MIKNIISGIILFSSVLFSQQCLDEWDYSITANNAIIAIQQENFSNIYISGTGETISIEYIECPMWIGVFYQSSEEGALECAGYTQWINNQNMAITAWGDDSTTPELDGMSSGDPYIFGLCIEGYEDFFIGVDPSMLSSGMFTDTYATNAFASLEGINFVTSDNCVGCIVENCWPININENKESRFLLRRVDIFGRIIHENNPKGLYFEVFNDKSVDKKFVF